MSEAKADDECGCRICLYIDAFIKALDDTYAEIIKRADGPPEPQAPMIAMAMIAARFINDAPDAQRKVLLGAFILSFEESLKKGRRVPTPVERKPADATAH